MAMPLKSKPQIEVNIPRPEVQDQQLTNKWA